MRVLAVYAHLSPKSFCQAVLEEFTARLRKTGHGALIWRFWEVA